MSWAGWIGVDDAVRQLQGALEGGRAHHAYLLAGPDGVGKRGFARAFAQWRLCEADGAGPCDQCSTCVRFRAGAHPGWMEAGTGGERGETTVADIREVIRRLHVTQDGFGMRFGLIGRTHRLHVGAQNALLKTLEEPPPRTLLFLTAVSPQDLLPTVLSRVQILRFRGLTTEEVVAVVGRRHPEVSSEDCRIAARYSGGSPGRVLRMIEEEFVDLHRRMDALFAASAPAAEIVETVDRAVRGGASNTEASRHRLRDVFNVFLHDIRDAARESSGLSVEPASAFRSWATARHDPDRLETLCLDAFSDLSRNVNLRLLIERFFLRLEAASPV